MEFLEPSDVKGPGRSFRAVNRKRIFYWNWCYLRPFLKKVFPVFLHEIVRQIRARFQPTLEQYPPIPMKLPTYREFFGFSQPESLPVVSIVTPSLNQAQFLERTIQSVLGQQYPNLEYVIMDGVSEDGTDRILLEYTTRVTYLESRQDFGQANAINRGFHRTTGEIMAWLNADDLLLPGSIAYIAEFFLKHPEVDVIYGYRICIDEDDREIGRWILPPHDNAIVPWANYIPQETLFWRRRIWEKIGGYLDESYQFVMDWDLLMRFQRVGATFIRLPHFLGAFRVHSRQKTNRMADIGKLEAASLHQKYHGYSVEWLNIRYQVRQYLLRCAWYYLLYYLGVSRDEVSF